MYILYLHPGPTNPLVEKCLDIFNQTGLMIESKKLDKNSALDYPVHITLSSFFNCDLNELEKIKKSIEQEWELLPETNLITGIRPLIQPGIMCALLEETSISQLMKNLQNVYPKQIEFSNSGKLHLSLIYGFNSKFQSDVEKYFETQTFETNDDWVLKIWECDRYLTKWNCVFEIN